MTSAPCDCEIEWYSFRGTAFRIPMCEVCGRIDGYRVQDALNELLTRERNWALNEMATLVDAIPANQRWKLREVPDLDLVAVERVHTVIEDVRKAGNKRGTA